MPSRRVGRQTRLHCSDSVVKEPLWSEHWYFLERRSICPLTGRLFPHSQKDEIFRNDEPSLLLPQSTYSETFQRKMLPVVGYSQPMPAEILKPRSQRDPDKDNSQKCSYFGCQRLVTEKAAKQYIKKFREDSGFDDTKFYCCGGTSNFRSSSVTSQPTHHKLSAPCKETAWGVPAANKDTDNTHWLTWNTGELPAPGVQTRLVRPYPTPEPPSNYGEKGFVSPKLVKQPTTRRITPQPLPARAASHTGYNCGSTCAVNSSSKVAVEDNYNPSPHPYYRSWHTSGCDEYEAEVTYNMLQHLHGGKSSQLDRMRRNRTGRYEHPINFERKILHGTYKSLENPQEFYGTFYSNEEAMRRMDNSGSSYSAASLQRAPMDYYPVSYHTPRSGIGRSDHTASSFFQYTQPSVKSSFVIHPQWTSEHCEFSKKLKSTKNLSHLTANKGDNSFRYGSGRLGA